MQVLHKGTDISVPGLGVIDHNKPFLKNLQLFIEPKIQSEEAYLELLKLFAVLSYTGFWFLVTKPW